MRELVRSHKHSIVSHFFTITGIFLIILYGIHATYSTLTLVKKFLTWKILTNMSLNLVLFWKVICSCLMLPTWRGITLKGLSNFAFYQQSTCAGIFLVPLSHAWYLMGFFYRTLEIFDPQFFFFDGLSLRWNYCYFCNSSSIRQNFPGILWHTFGFCTCWGSSA